MERKQQEKKLTGKSIKAVRKKLSRTKVTGNKVTQFIYL